jgi:hypothetical protein
MKTINFYSKNSIILIVDVKDLDQKVPFKQQTAFYNLVGINKLNFENKTILELDLDIVCNIFYLLYNKLKRFIIF